MQELFHHIAQIEAGIRPLASYAAVILVFVLLLKNKVKKVSFGKLLVETGSGDTKETASITQHLEVRDYLHVIREAFNSIHDDIHLRIRQNGWLEIEDFTAYVEDAIVQHELVLTKYLNEHYYYNAKIDSAAIFELNLSINKEIRNIYRATYGKMFSILEKTRSEIEKKKQVLQNIEDKRACNHSEAKCGNVSEVIRLTTEICLTEYIQMKYYCLIEAERGINEIIQEYYSAYLAKYKEALQVRSA